MPDNYSKDKYFILNLMQRQETRIFKELILPSTWKDTLNKSDLLDSDWWFVSKPGPVLASSDDVKSRKFISYDFILSSLNSLLIGPNLEAVLVLYRPPLPSSVLRPQSINEKFTRWDTCRRTVFLNRYTKSWFCAIFHVSPKSVCATECDP